MEAEISRLFQRDPDQGFKALAAAIERSAPERRNMLVRLMTRYYSAEKGAIITSGHGSSTDGARRVLRDTRNMQQGKPHTPEQQLKQGDSAIILRADGGMTVHIDNGDDERITPQGLKIAILAKLISHEVYEPLWEAIYYSAKQEIRELENDGARQEIH